MKALAILMVITTHMELGSRSNPVFPFVIEMAVPIFMLISGINYARSYERHKVSTLREMYSWKNIWHRIKPMAEPLAVVYVVEILIMTIQGSEELNVSPFKIAPLIVKNYLRGGFGGYGSYYFPVMLQIILLFPVIYILVKRLRGNGIIAVCALNLVYEIFVFSSGMNEEDYRIIGIRYILYVAFGVWISLYGDLFMTVGRQWKRGIMVLMIPIGIFYIYLYWYGSVKVPPFQYWLATGMITTFYFFPIFYLGYENLKNIRIKGWIGLILEKIGASTWFIMLFQMFYYEFFPKGLSNNLPVIPQWFVNMAICLAGGFLYKKSYMILCKKAKEIRNRAGSRNRLHDAAYHKTTINSFFMKKDM